MRADAVWGREDQAERVDAQGGDPSRNTKTSIANGEGVTTGSRVFLR